MRGIVAYIVIVLASFAVIGATYHFTLKSDIEIINSSLTVSPGSFSLQIAPGCEVVKEIKIKNNGDDEREIYFDKTVEGENPDAISVYFHTSTGESITQSNKLRIPPLSEVTVYVHVKADDDAAGENTVYIMAKG